MKVIYVVLVCLLAFTSCAETEYAENGVDKKNITGYTEVGFYSLGSAFVSLSLQKAIISLASFIFSLKMSISSSLLSIWRTIFSRRSIAWEYVSFFAATMIDI